MSERSVDLILRELEEHDCRPRGNEDRGWQALCPAHDDRSPSLHVTYAPAEGKTLCHCFAGCETQAVMDALGVDIAALFDDDRAVSLRRFA